MIVIETKKEQSSLTSKDAYDKYLKALEQLKETKEQLNYLKDAYNCYVERYLNNECTKTAVLKYKRFYILWVKEVMANADKVIHLKEIFDWLKKEGK